MKHKQYKVIEMVLNGASFSHVDNELGYCKNGSRAAFYSWIRRLNKTVYDAGLTDEQKKHITKYGSLEDLEDREAWKSASTSIDYLRLNKEHFLKNIPDADAKEILSYSIDLEIDKAILLLVKNGYRVERQISN